MIVSLPFFCILTLFLLLCTIPIILRASVTVPCCALHCTLRCVTHCAVRLAVYIAVLSDSLCLTGNLSMYSV